MIIKNPDGRFWEIDFLRGIAIVLMVIFHFIYDLNHIRIIYYKLWEGAFDYVSKITAAVFFLLVGISLTISYNKKQPLLSNRQLTQRFIFRGGKLIILGMIITIISFFIINERFVIFGVLHCIGVSIILAIPFISFRFVNILIGSMVILLGIILKFYTFQTTLLLPLGFMPPHYFSIDYFPLLPWFGAVLIGISLGHYLYPDAQRKFNLKRQADNPVIRKTCFIGRHSLHVYFLHQPIVFTGIHLYLHFFM